MPDHLMLEISASGEAESEPGVPLLGWHLASAVERPSPSPYSVRIEGWALARSGPPDRVDVVATAPLPGGGALRRTLVSVVPNLTRPRVGERFPDVRDSGMCGFYAGCTLLGLPAAFDLRIEACFGDRAAAIGMVRGRRRELPADGPSHSDPLLITTMGRAGSTWLTRLLGEHPGVIAYRPFQFEPRITSYWLEILRTLANPHTYAQGIDPDVRGGQPWWVGDRRKWGPLDIPDEELLEWLETDSLEDLARFCRARIAGFYERAAAAAGKAATSRFAERVGSWHDLVLAAELFSESREVFLVRDFRDVLASRLAFNAKTGTVRFGREEAASDEEYIEEQMRREVATLLEIWRARQDRALLVRYEDLMGAPRETLVALFEHANVVADEATVDQVLRRADELRAARRDWHMTAGGGPESVGRWRADLPPALGRAADEAFSEALAAFGY